MVLCVSRYSRKKFLSWSNIDPEKVKVLPNTYDCKKHFLGSKSRDVLEKFNVQKKKIILTVGRLSSGEMYKGHDKVVRIMVDLLKKDPSWVYWIVGEGDDRERLQSLAVSFGVEKQVQFLGYVSDEELPDVYRTADVFIMLSKGEGFGIVFLEAAANGTSVIADNSCGAVDPLCDGRFGRLIDSNITTDIIKAIEESVTDPVDSESINEVFSFENFSMHLQHIINADVIRE